MHDNSRIATASDARWQLNNGRSERAASRDVSLAAIADLIGDSSRAAMLDALLGGQALPARELARRGNVRPSTASAHLAKLVRGGLLVVETRGRQRWYGLANAEVAHALEALAVIAPPAAVRSLRESLANEQIRSARSCYDHLAGRLGVQLTEALRSIGALRQVESSAGGATYDVTSEGAYLFSAFGLDLMALRQQRRSFARPCLDWSERRYHLAGSLGAALLTRSFALGWIERSGTAGRAVRMTPSGRDGFTALLGQPFDMS